MLHPFSPERTGEVAFSRRAEKALLRQAKAMWAGTREGLKHAVRRYVRRHRGDGTLFSVLRSPGRAPAAALLALQLYASPVGANGGGIPFGAAQADPFGLQGVGSSSAPAFGDLDNDGDLDLVSGNGNGNVYFENNSSPSILLAIGEAYSTPGDEHELKLDITLTNTAPVAGLQFDLDFSQLGSAELAGQNIANYLTGEVPTGFVRNANRDGDLLSVLVYSLSGELIPPSAQPVRLGRLHFTPGESEGTGTVGVYNLLVSDENAESLSANSEDGALHVIEL